MSPFEAAQMEEFHASSEDRQNRSQQQNFERLAMVECFWEEAFPDSKFTKSLQEMRDWCDSGEKTKVIPIGQIGVTEYIAFVGYLTKTGIIAGLLGGDIEGRGCGFPTVEKINTIISWLSNQSNVTDPCCIDEVKQYVTDLKKKHTTRGAGCALRRFRRVLAQAERRCVEIRSQLPVEGAGVGDDFDASQYDRSCVRVMQILPPPLYLPQVAGGVRR
jgi:hypothetical protein